MYECRYHMFLIHFSKAYTNKLYTHSHNNSNINTNNYYLPLEKEERTKNKLYIALFALPFRSIGNNNNNTVRHSMYAYDNECLYITINIYVLSIKRTYCHLKIYVSEKGTTNRRSKLINHSLYFLMQTFTFILSFFLLCRYFLVVRKDECVLARARWKARKKGIQKHTNGNLFVGRNKRTTLIVFMCWWKLLCLCAFCMENRYASIA